MTDGQLITGISGIAATACTAFVAYLTLKGKKVDNSTTVTMKTFESLHEQVEELRATSKDQALEIKELQTYRNKYEALKVKYDDLKRKFDDLLENIKNTKEKSHETN